MDNSDQKQQMQGINFKPGQLFIAVLLEAGLQLVFSYRT